MASADISLVIAAVAGCTGVVTAIGNIIIQLETLKTSRANSEKIEINTLVTEAAQKAAIQAVAAASSAAREAKQTAVVATSAIAGVAATLAVVQTATDGITEKLVASALAQGNAEGKLAGVAAEQARAAGSTGQMPILKEFT
jgi:hypothetical protein